MDCTVCGKPVQIIGADTCSTRCMLQAARGAAGQKGKRMPSSGYAMIGKLAQASLTPPQPEPEVPMLKVAHPWIKHRNIVEGETIFSFNGEGVAVVKDLGNARVDLQRLLKKPTGKFYIPEEKMEGSIPSPAPEVITSASVILEPVKPVKLEEPVRIEKPPVEPEEETTGEIEVTKRTPAKKKSGGKKE